MQGMQKGMYWQWHLGPLLESLSVIISLSGSFDAARAP